MVTYVLNIEWSKQRSVFVLNPKSNKQQDRKANINGKTYCFKPKLGYFSKSTSDNICATRRTDETNGRSFHSPSVYDGLLRTN